MRVLQVFSGRRRLVAAGILCAATALAVAWALEPAEPESRSVNVKQWSAAEQPKAPTRGIEGAVAQIAGSLSGTSASDAVGAAAASTATDGGTASDAAEPVAGETMEVAAVPATIMGDGSDASIYSGSTGGSAILGSQASAGGGGGYAIASVGGSSARSSSGGSIGGTGGGGSLGGGSAGGGALGGGAGDGGTAGSPAGLPGEDLSGTPGGGNDPTPGTAGPANDGADTGSNPPQQAENNPPAATNPTGGNSGGGDGGQGNPGAGGSDPVIGGSGPIEGELIVGPDRTVSPGHSPGNLDVIGDMKLAGGTLLIEIGGTVFDPTAGTGVYEYDRLTVDGNAYLDGTVQITLLDLSDPDNNANPFMPQLGDIFDIVVADAVYLDNDDPNYVSPTFPTMFDGLDLANGYYLFPLLAIGEDGRAALRLEVRRRSEQGQQVATSLDYQEVPEPGTIAGFAFGLGTLGFVARRQRRKTKA